MIRQCSYCRVLLGQTKPADDQKTIPGLCSACLHRIHTELRAAIAANLTGANQKAVETPERTAADLACW